MQKPNGYIVRMVLFILVFGGLSAFLREPLIVAFMSNPGLNGVILATLLIGIIYAMRRVFDLFGEVQWISAFKRRAEVPIESKRAPRLMAPAAALLASHESGEMKLSTLSMRSVLDGIASRLEESREISRYLTSLLIFLGLLGTFWGLIKTVGSIGTTIETLTVDGGDPALMFDTLKDGLREPLSGMSVAFSSSLFGLSGSLVLGFMDLQASQAQTRFYNNVEEWLASVTQLSRGTSLEEGAGPNAYMTALMEQTADGIDKLSRTLGRSDDGRIQLQTSMTEIAEAIATLSDKMAVGDSAGRAETKALAGAIEKLAAKGEDAPAPGLDEASRSHLRNVDVGIKRMIEENARANEILVDELRGELKLLARTLAASMDQVKSAPAPTPVAAPAPSVEPQPAAPMPKLADGEPTAETAPPVLTAKREDDDDSDSKPGSGPNFNPFDGPKKGDA